MWIWLMLACGAGPEAANSLVITNDAHPYVIHREMRSGPARPTSTGSHADHFEIGRFAEASAEKREPKEAPIFISIKMPEPVRDGTPWKKPMRKLTWTKAGDGFRADMKGDNGEIFEFSCKAPWVADCGAVVAEYALELPKVVNPTKGL